MQAAKETLPPLRCPPPAHSRHTHTHFPRIPASFNLSQKPSQVIPQAAGGKSLASIAIVKKKERKKKCDAVQLANFTKHSLSHSLQKTPENPQ